MQRLFSLKIIFQTSRNVPSFGSQLISSLPKTNPLPQFNPHQPYFFSHYCATCSNSWRNGFVSNPVLAKQLLPNATALLKGQSKSLFHHEIGFFKPQFSRRSYHYGGGVPGYKKWRIWLSRKLTADHVLWGIILSNIGIFMIWRSADPGFMRRNFMVSLDNLRNLRLHTMITSGFSQADTGHLILNMLGLYFFGTNIGRIFGGEFLLTLYLAGAFVGSAFFLVGQKYLEKSVKKTQTWGIDHSKVSGLGASGAVNAVMLLDIFLFPKNIVFVEFIFPVPAILLGAFIIGKDLWRVLEGDTEISGAAHLGGAVVAAVSWLRIVKRI